MHATHTHITTYMIPHMHTPHTHMHTPHGHMHTPHTHIRGLWHWEMILQTADLSNHRMKMADMMLYKISRFKEQIFKEVVTGELGERGRKEGKLEDGGGGGGGGGGRAGWLK